MRTTEQRRTRTFVPNENPLCGSFGPKFRTCLADLLCVNGSGASETRRRFTLATLAPLLAVSAALLFAAAPAFAVKEYVPSSVAFGGAGTGAGQLKEPTGVSANASTELADPAAGDVYVADTGNNRIEQFTAGGVFVAAWGWGVSDGKHEYEICTSSCGSGITGIGEGQLDLPEMLAVDNSTEIADLSKGDVYVVNNADQVIETFGATGQLQSQVTGTCEKPGEAPPCIGSRLIPFGQLLGVAVDPSGNVWVHDSNANFDEFSSAGTFLKTFNIENITPHPGGLASDSAGGLYEIAGNASAFENVVAKVEPATNVGLAAHFGEGATAVAIDPATDALLVDDANRIERFGPFGKPYNEALQLFATESIAESRGIAVGANSTAYASDRLTDRVAIFDFLLLPSATTGSTNEVGETTEQLHGTVNPGGIEVSECYFEYGATTSYGYKVPCQQTSAELGTGTQPVAVSAEALGLQRGTYHFRLAAANANGTTRGQDATFVMFPLVEGASVSSVGSTEAKVSAQISAADLPTTYIVEYGTSTTYGASTSRESIGAPHSAISVSARLTGLQPGTRYHFRFVATDQLGTTPGADVAFITTGASEAGMPGGHCPNSALLGFDASLPDCRAYELVSSPRDPAEIYTNSQPAKREADPYTERLVFQVAADGHAVAYVADPAASGGNGLRGNGVGNQWLATRTPAGWQASDITSSGEGESASEASGNQFVSFSNDLSVGILTAHSPSLAAKATPQGPAACAEEDNAALYYTRTAESGALRSLFTPTDAAEGCGSPLFAGASSDDSQLFFQTNARLTSEASEITGEPGAGGCEFDCNLYDSSGARLSLVNVLSDGQTAAGAVFGGVPPGHPQEQNAPVLGGVVSADGSRAFWTDTQAGHDMEHIYLRENPDRAESPLGPKGECTVATDACTIPVSAGAAKYWTATPDGRYAFYIEGGTLWRFDAERKTSQQLVGEGLNGENAATLGLLGTSDDGSYLYFVAEDALAEGAVHRTCNSVTEGHQVSELLGVLPPRKGCNLYFLHVGETPKLVAVLSARDDHQERRQYFSGGSFEGGDWQPALGARTAEVTPDGQSVVFESSQHLTGYDSSPLSVGGDRENSIELFVYNAGTGRIACPSCSPTGAAPTSEAGNGEEESERLESEGKGSYLPIHPGLHAAGETSMPHWISADGSRVFFATSQPLVSQDTNGLQDVYEWEREGAPSCPAATSISGGCVFMLSGGESSDFSYLIGADANGENVFFSHRGQLGDAGPVDGTSHVFDARVRGGFFSSSLACSGTGCQGVPPAPPQFATPSSATFNGVGNFPTQPAVQRKTAIQTRGVLLARALKACRKKTNRHKRSVCEKQAHRRYRPAKSTAEKRRHTTKESK